MKEFSMEIGLVNKVDIDHEMQQSYLNYAMSVIVSRALPDARDGLKPVQRRILYGMYEMGIRIDSSYKKSARIVGEVLGKYHPHGDMAVYESMARLAQDFTMRCRLVDGQGNFGSVDGDPPAAMRYTEARLMPFAMELLSQIDRNTVDFVPNFDATLNEPEVLPAAVPNLLVNGASGIAVGMATNIPPHNLGEVVDALIYMLAHWEKLDEVVIEDLMKFIKGPDFPTGGIILQSDHTDELLTAYATGKGRVIVRGRMHLEEMGRNRSRIIISELPYLTNKSALVERIAELVREGGLEGISDLRDESDRQGMRIVIELKQGAKEEDILRELYKRTPLQSTLGMNMLALVNNEPHLLSLKQALRVYIEHRLVVVKRRSEYDLAKAKARAHILAGLRIAIKYLDEIIALIRAAPDVDTARQKLMKKYSLFEIQANAILDMPLKKLSTLERKKIEQEYKELIDQIHDLETLISSPKKMRSVVEAELIEMKATYSDRRRTQIVSLQEGESLKSLLTTNDVTPAQEVWVGVTPEGLIARTHSDELPRVSGRQAARWLLRTNTHHTLYLVSNQGQAAAVAVHMLPEVEKFSDGVEIHHVSPFNEGESLAAIFCTPPRQNEDSGNFIVTVTNQGTIKKSSIQELPGPSAHLFPLVKINSGEQLTSVMITNGSSEILIASQQGMAIHFLEEEVRPIGLVAAGVAGIKLAAGDQVVDAVALSGGEELLFLAGNGLAWRIKDSDFPMQGRNGQGIIVCRLAKGVHIAGLLIGKKNQLGLVHFTKAAARQIRVDEVAMTKRAVKGQALCEIKEGDSIQKITPLLDGLAFWEQKKATPKAKRTAKVKKG
jgi:DNA gyrase subunit A